jgi:4-hydroxybenzoate polyprenyltransferase
MISRSSLIHLRLPFSYFLLPVYLLALVAAGTIDPVKAWIVFLVLHFFLYTAANGFNSFYDRDTESIGVLRRPPSVTKDLLWLSFILDAAGILIAFAAGWRFALASFIYGCASKAYSWDRTRIKKHPVGGWLFAGIGQGTLTFLCTVQAVTGCTMHDLFSWNFLQPAAATGLFILGFFPLTQIYQHREDARRGDMTISLFLGIRGTLTLAAGSMTAAVVMFVLFFNRTTGMHSALFFIGALVPAAVYFIRWFFLCTRNSAKADFDHAMTLSIMAATGLIVFSLSRLFHLYGA